MTANHSLRKTRSKFFLRLLFGAGLLGLIASRVEFSQLTRVFSQADTIKLGIGLSLILFIAPAIGSLQVTILLKGLGHPLSFKTVWTIDMTSRFYGVSIPSGLGHGAVRWYRLGTALSDRALSTVCILVNRLVQSIIAVGLGLLCWYVDQGIDQIGLAFVSGLGLLAAIYGLILSNPARALLRHLCGRVHAWPLKGFFNRFIDSLESAAATNPLLQCALFLSATCRQLVNIYATYILAVALGLPISFLLLGWTRAIGFIVSLLPLSVAEVGVRELTYLTILERHGVNSQQALALPLLLTSAVLILASAGGLIELVQRRG